MLLRGEGGWTRLLPALLRRVGTLRMGTDKVRKQPRMGRLHATTGAAGNWRNLGAGLAWAWQATTGAKHNGLELELQDGALTREGVRPIQAAAMQASLQRRSAADQRASRRSADPVVVAPGRVVGQPHAALPGREAITSAAAIVQSVGRTGRILAGR